MNHSDDNKCKWQLAFWITTVLSVSIAFFIGNAVIANDRIRAEEDKAIRFDMNEKFDKFYATQNKVNQLIYQIAGKLDVKVSSP